MEIQVAKQSRQGSARQIYFVCHPRSYEREKLYRKDPWIQSSMGDAGGRRRPIDQASFSKNYC